MTGLTEHAKQQLGYVAITIVAFIGLNWINEAFFLRFEHGSGVNWVFLPAGIRLLATLLFGFAGFIGLLLASLYLNFHHFAFQEVRALSGAVAAAAGPYLAYLFAKHWFDLGPRLRNLTLGRLLFTGLLCGVVSPVLNHAFVWVHTGTLDWAALLVMMVGDIAGILIVLTISKGLLTLTDPRDVDAHLR
ncbi:hypothetical protein [Massilia sp. Leaf139]|uniref:hypothetical protein n=1 Tax=Massilia sp. Leaf139 TaxID=1736272 RepID=UPI000700A8E8|nr:hypothetical protein [Massilia sp. Leaf139]KQQ91887.1 hypothetical protein ASF77_08125 [Massilia sp. Leaf139]